MNRIILILTLIVSITSVAQSNDVNNSPEPSLALTDKLTVAVEDQGAKKDLPENKIIEINKGAKGKSKLNQEVKRELKHSSKKTIINNNLDLNPKSVPELKIHSNNKSDISNIKSSSTKNNK